MDKPPLSSDPEQSTDAEEVEEGAVERPKFKPTEKDELKQDRHMEANPQQEVGTLLAKGDEFGSLGANAIALADLIRSYATTIFEVAVHAKRPGDVPAYPAVRNLKIASAKVLFIAGENESIQLDDPESSPAVRASQKVTELMSAEDEDLVEMAREIGPKGAAAYRSVLKAIGDSQNAKVSWASPGGTPVVVTAIGAQKAFRTLTREGESESDGFTVLGRLSMADEYKNRFELRLYKGAPRPPQVKRRRLVKGSFDETLGEFVKEQNLWGKDVEAVIHVERERADTVATPRDPSFVLLSVRATPGPPAPRKNREPMPGSAALDEGIDVDVFGDSE
jgi:hypothetical protein